VLAVNPELCTEPRKGRKAEQETGLSFIEERGRQKLRAAQRCEKNYGLSSKMRERTSAST
jgi:hypothetical protein